MANALQTRNFTKLFRAWDSSGNGALTWDDYEGVIGRFEKEMGIQPGSSEHDMLTKTFREDWQMLQQNAAGSDGSVSLDQWIAYHDKMVSDEQGYQVAVGSFSDMFLSLADTNGDGKLSSDEYATILRAFGFDDSRAKEAFDHLDRDSQGEVTSAELRQAAGEFFRSDDPNAKGHWVFGHPE